MHASQSCGVRGRREHEASCPIWNQLRSVSADLHAQFLSLMLRSGNPAQVIVQLSHHTATALPAIGVTQADLHLLLQISTSVPISTCRSEIYMHMYHPIIKISYKFASRYPQILVNLSSPQDCMVPALRLHPTHRWVPTAL